ncbi:MAG TPA: arylsulfotransferase family protein [Polyangiaceae bacterium]
MRPERGVALVVFAVVFAAIWLLACSGASDRASSDAGRLPVTEASADGGIAGDGTTAAGDGGRDASADAPDDSAATFDGGTTAPALALLAVSSPAQGGPVAVELTPPFSPSIHDYAVRCAAGPNLFTIAVTAATGSESLLVQPVPSPSLPSQSLTVQVNENQAVVAAATNPAGTEEYWVRCLPHDFPQIAWTPHPAAGTPPPGYYLVGTALPTTSGCYAMVLDGNGVPVWYTPAQAVDGWCVFDVDAVVPGALTFDSLVDEPTAFELHQLSPLATTRIAPNGLNTDLHELRLLANGDYLVISTPLQPGIDVTGMQVPLPEGGVETMSGPQTIMACDLVEFRPDGSVVWTWTATDHFDAVADSVAPELAPYGPAGTTVVLDPFHCNSIDVDPSSGNLLVSAREMDSVFYVERSTGRVLWKMGGASASKDGATYVSVADPFALQHDARLQPDWSPECGGSGQISLFDDEVPGLPAAARAVVYDVAVGAGDGGSLGDGGCPDGGTTPGTGTVEWKYEGPAPSTAMGSFRISADGSRVVGWGLASDAAFTEVDGSGNDLLDVAFTDGNTTYRAIKVPLATFDLGLLRSTAGLP